MCVTVNILLTGKPRIGKSTILSKFIDTYPNQVGGFVAEEIRDENNNRVGFKFVTIDGRSAVFAHKTDIDSPHTIGSYHVDLNVINSFAVPELKQAAQEDKLILIDEIGRMQNFSNDFMQTIVKILDENIPFVGTIVKESEPWSMPIRSHDKALLIEVNKATRDALPEVLVQYYTQKDKISKLTPEQQNFIYDSFTDFYQQEKLMQIKKLFKNALSYYLENRINSRGNDTFVVRGNHNSYRTTVAVGVVECECNLFKGRGKYQGKAGICSHILAIQLAQLT